MELQLIALQIANSMERAANNKGRLLAWSKRSSFVYLISFWTGSEREGSMWDKEGKPWSKWCNLCQKEKESAVPVVYGALKFI